MKEALKVFGKITEGGQPRRPEWHALSGKEHRMTNQFGQTDTMLDLPKKKVSPLVKVFEAVKRKL